MSEFRKELESLINRHSKENGCDTPDFILADFLSDCLNSFDQAVNRREAWYGRAKRECAGSGEAPLERERGAQ